MSDAENLTVDDLLSSIPPAEHDPDGSLKDYTGEEIELASGWRARLDFTVSECWVLRFFRGSERRELPLYAGNLDWAVNWRIAELERHAQAVCRCR